MFACPAIEMHRSLGALNVSQRRVHCDLQRPASICPPEACQRGQKSSWCSSPAGAGTSSTGRLYYALSLHRPSPQDPPEAHATTPTNGKAGQGRTGEGIAFANLLTFPPVDETVEGNTGHI